MINCYVFYAIIYSKRYLKYVLAPCLLVMYSCMQEFNVLPASFALAEMSSRVYVYNSFLFRAFPLFLFGVIMREKLSLVLQIPINTRWLLILAVVGMLCAGIESRIFAVSQFYIGSYITAFSLMVLALKKPDFGGRFLFHVGRDLSMWVYILHVAVGKVMDMVGKYCRLWGTDFWNIARPICVLVGTFLLAETVFWIKSRAAKDVCERKKGFL